MNVIDLTRRIQSWPRLIHHVLAGRIITLTGRRAKVPWDCKYAVIDKYVKMSGATVFVESGTCHGNTPARLEDEFDQLHTIEVDTALYEGACARFKDHPKIKVWKGDSAVVLPEVLKQINATCLFWLDGHYSGPGTGLAETGECPVVQELEAIYRHPVKNHVILIDDAWSFGVIKGYPAPEEIERMAASKDPAVRMSLEHEIMVLRSVRNE